MTLINFNYHLYYKNHNIPDDQLKDWDSIPDDQLRHQSSILNDQFKHWLNIPDDQLRHRVYPLMAALGLFQQFIWEKGHWH
ncbi:hypothetical protein [Halomonas sp. BC04]|uniref:hypothetical protein n=1 Tax=Halomonas sp. BC04 TaxID=1403540 RepID=UPI0003ED8042|nr:hypothetical protein [Halomonas sp. BC04]EWG98909.1 hypothetical protein Q427_27880 [Halomonas sp. BC04]